MAANPETLPTKWGWGEPDELVFFHSDFSRALSEAGDLPSGSQIGWQRNSSPKLLCSLAGRWISKVPSCLDTHSIFTISGELKECKTEFWVGNLLRASAELDADLGIIEAVTGTYKERARASYAMPFSDLYLTTHVLRHWLPDIFWGTLFGQAYIEMFGLDTILNLPAAKVERVGSDKVYVQLTENIDDLENHPEVVLSRREEVKRALQCDAFYDANRSYSFHGAGPVGSVFKTPKFALLD